MKKLFMLSYENLSDEQVSRMAKWALDFCPSFLIMTEEDNTFVFSFRDKKDYTRFKLVFTQWYK